MPIRSEFRRRQFAVGASCLGAFALGLACSGDAGCGSSHGVEPPPARPCTINGMLFRDTPDDDFKRCGRSSLPLDGEVADCVKSALADEQPFVVEVSAAGDHDVGDQPALAGAHFDGGYGVRMYIARGDAQGERTELEIVKTSPDRETLSTMVTNLQPYRCRMGVEMPQGEAWSPADDRDRRMVDTSDCAEWFDESEWRRQPWNSSYDADAVLRCARPSSR